VIQAFAFIGAGILVYLTADWLGCLFSYRADKGESDGVMRYGGLSRKIWKEDEPEKFASRIDNDLFAAKAIRSCLKIFGAIFAIAGIIQLMGSLPN
jgi:hypothetical protein